MKVYVQVVDKRSGIYQTGMIEEPVEKRFEVANAIEHLGVNHHGVDWEVISESYRFGIIRDTTKVVSVIIV